MKKILTFVTSLSLAFTLVACGSGSTDNSGGEEQGSETNLPSQLVVATGGTSGVYYPLGGGIAQIISDNTDVNASAQVTGGSVENMRFIGSGDAEIAFVQNDIADYAKNGLLMFEGSQVENLQGIATLYNESVQIVVREDSDIESVSDLKGKAVSVGAPGSGVEANASQILEVYGLSFEDLKTTHLSFGDSVQQIQDGSLEAAFLTAGAPTSAVTELSATSGVKIIQIDEDKIEELISKHSFYVKDTIPAETYPGVGEVSTVAVKAMLVVSSDLPEEFVYDVTKAIFENKTHLAAINTRAESISIESALEGMSIDLHPGAQKFFEEQGLK